MGVQYTIYPNVLKNYYWGLLPFPVTSVYGAPGHALRILEGFIVMVMVMVLSNVSLYTREPMLISKRHRPE